jgi:hypothetical protein
MSLDLAEFHRGLKALAPDIPLEEKQTIVAVPSGGKKVTIDYAPLENATLGKSLSLPRARVTIDVSTLGEDERRAFLARFDKAFQRGGG